MTKTIPLTRGRVAIVDEEDYKRLSAYKWRANGQEYTYALTAISVDGKQKSVPMHRMIMGVEYASHSVYVDHRNGDTLDNRKDNLRLCNNHENQGNSKPRGGVSKYRGVCWNRTRQKWQANIKVYYRQKHLGHFDDEEDAARAYDRAARQHFGDFARCNFDE